MEEVVLEVIAFRVSVSSQPPAIEQSESAARLGHVLGAESVEGGHGIADQTLVSLVVQQSVICQCLVTLAYCYDEVAGVVVQVFLAGEQSQPIFVYRQVGHQIASFRHQH